MLVATDGSDRASRATTSALDLAEQSDGPLHALHVVETDRHGEAALSSPELLDDDLEDEG